MRHGHRERSERIGASGGSGPASPSCCAGGFLPARFLRILSVPLDRDTHHWVEGAAEPLPPLDAIRASAFAPAHESPLRTPFFARLRRGEWASR